MRSSTRPPLTRRSSKPAMLTITYCLPRSSGIQRKRSMAMTMLWMRPWTGTFIETIGGFDQCAVVSLRVVRRGPGAVGQHQPRANSGHPGIGHAWLERLAEGHGGPASLGGKCAIGCKGRAKLGIAGILGLPGVEKPIETVDTGKSFQRFGLIDAAALDKEIGINLPRQETADSDVGGIFQEGRRKIEFNEGQAALVVSGLGGCECRKLLARVVFWIETVAGGVMKARQKLIGAAAPEPEQLASEFLVVLPQCVAPLPDRKRQAGLADQKVQHVDANDCKFAGRTDDLCKRIRCLPGQGKAERRERNRDPDRPSSPCHGQDTSPHFSHSMQPALRFRRGRYGVGRRKAYRAYG